MKGTVDAVKPRIIANPMFPDSSYSYGIEYLEKCQNNFGNRQDNPYAPLNKPSPHVILHARSFDSPLVE